VRPSKCCTRPGYGAWKEHRALPRRVQIERVHVEGALAARVLARYEQIDPQQLIAHVFRESAHTIAAVALVDDDLVAVDLNRRVQFQQMAELPEKDKRAVIRLINSLSVARSSEARAS
jgi:hypothetical protein